MVDAPYLYKPYNELYNNEEIPYLKDNEDERLVPETLYMRLEALVQLERRIEAHNNLEDGKPSFGDAVFTEYNALVKSLPSLFSLSDVLSYHQHLVGREEDEKQATQSVYKTLIKQTEKILNELRAVARRKLTA